MQLCQFPQSINRDAGLDYLRQLLQEAHREYQDYVATGVMTARVFALQFLDGHHYADSKKAARKNIHRKVMGAIGILLLERTDLVKQFFSKPSLETEAIDRIIVLVYTEQRYDGSSNVETRKIKPKSVIRISQCCMAVRNPNDRFGIKRQIAKMTWWRKRIVRV